MSTHVKLAGTFEPAKGTRVGDVDQNAPIEVTIDLRGPALPDADHLPDPPLTFDQFAARYGSRPEDAQAVAKVLGGFGLKVVETSLGTRSMRMSGSVKAMEAAFQTKLGIYDAPDQAKFRSREGDLQVPAELNGIVKNVVGLDE